MPEPKSAADLVAVAEVEPGARAECLLRVQGDCVAVAEPHGRGYLVVLGDLQFVDDHWDPEDADNQDFLKNLVTP